MSIKSQSRARTLRASTRKLFKRQITLMTIFMVSCEQPFSSLSLTSSCGSIKKKNKMQNLGKQLLSRIYVPRTSLENFLFFSPALKRIFPEKKVNCDNCVNGKRRKMFITAEAQQRVKLRQQVGSFK